MTTRFEAAQAKAWSRYRIMSVERGEESANGPGSWLESTEQVRRWLPHIFKTYDIHTMLDAPCGDWNWMSHVDLSGISYLGIDVEPSTIIQNQGRYGDRPGVRFMGGNLLTMAVLPRVDLIFCRDFLQHLPNTAIEKVLWYFARSGSKYLITNNYAGATNTYECPKDGHSGAVGSPDPLPGYFYRPVNVEAAPFYLKGRKEAIVEHVLSAEEYSEITQELVLFELTGG